MTYGGGTIKRSGLYDRLMELLKDFEIFELGGIEPNPRVSTVNRGVDICKKEGIDLILAVGGGSTIDCSKAIAAVISNEKTEEKLLMGHPLLLPRVSVLNPENTFTVPAYQTAAGAADMMSHILESYFDQEEAFVPDAISEGLLRAVIKYAPIALKEPDNYETADLRSMRDNKCQIPLANWMAGNVLLIFDTMSRNGYNCC